MVATVQRQGIFLAIFIGCASCPEDGLKTMATRSQWQCDLNARVGMKVIMRFLLQ